MPTTKQQLEDKAASLEARKAFCNLYLPAVIYNEDDPENIGRQIVSIEMGREFDNCWIITDRDTLRSAHIQDQTILLRPYTSLTDSEVEKALNALGFLNIFNDSDKRDALYDRIKKLQDSEQWSGSFTTAIHLSDYLRSIGIQLPFRGYSCEEQISLGWAKLTEGGGE